MVVMPLGKPSKGGLNAISSLALLQTAASSSSIAYSALRSRQCWNDGMVPLPSASWQPSDRDARIESAVSSMQAGAGLNSALCSDHVTFRHAAALCCGGAEKRWKHSVQCAR